MNGKLNVKQADGALRVTGQTDLTFGIGGVGDIDIGQGNNLINDNTAWIKGGRVNLPGHTLQAGTGFVRFSPYYQVDYSISSKNRTQDPTKNFPGSAITFDGRLSARIITDLGNFTSYFPSPDTDFSQNFNRDSNKIAIPTSNVLYSVSNGGGTIAMNAYTTFGMEMGFYLSDGIYNDFIDAYSPLPDVRSKTSKAFLANRRRCNLYITQEHSSISSPATLMLQERHVPITVRSK